MAQCTAPSRGHRTASAAENCPACSSRGRYSYGGGYGSGYSSSSPSYGSGTGGGSRSTGGGSSGGSPKPRWSRAGSSVSYTPAQVQSLTPIRETVERRAAAQPELRDVFLCHAWGDRQGAAKELRDLLVVAGVKVWFSENDLPLGVPMMRAIDKGLAASRIGLVLVTPALLERLPTESVADKELSTLLAGNLLVPIIHNTTYEALRNVSPMLASRSGLSTAEDSMAVVATKIAELVQVLTAP
ncbi:TIR domain protein [Hydrogenophaga crassostreae]|uniref:TIR domain protein n=1 Tax=Hydrogenophaga crassostreae TaxID=1763535 RepID=A0A167HR07_9BURK|nr:TIR domain protein [Hydrogenophaga crassostreae]OAD41613.1 TIR domain protein [Hydrogenophaga crassostreae]